MTLSDEAISTLSEAINKIIESGLAEDVLKRLDSFGYTTDDSDIWSIAFCIQKVENYIKNDCNTPDVPSGLITYAVDMVCGEFLQGKYTTGQLALDALDLDGAIASVSAGDTSVSFDNNTSDDGKFNSLVQTLTTCGRGQMACFRQLKW